MADLPPGSQPPPPMSPPPAGPQPAYYPPPPKKSGALKWVLIGCGVLTGVVLLTCGGCFVVGYVLYGKFKPFIEEGQKFVKTNRVLQEELGEMREVQMDQTRTEMKEDSARFVFNVRGSRSTGTVEVNFQKKDGTWKAVGGTLTKDDGTRIPLAGTSD